MPYYQSGLGNTLCYEITFNNYNQVIVSPGLPAKPDAKYKITNMFLESKIVTQLDRARYTALKYQSMALPYNRVLRDRQMNKSHTTWSWSFNMSCRFFKGILQGILQGYPRSEYVTDKYALGLDFRMINA